MPALHKCKYWSFNQDVLFLIKDDIVDSVLVINLLDYDEEDTVAEEIKKTVSRTMSIFARKSESEKEKSRKRKGVVKHENESYDILASKEISLQELIEDEVKVKTIDLDLVHGIGCFSIKIMAKLFKPDLCV